MASPAKSTFMIALLFVVLGLAIAVPNTNKITILCNSGVYTTGDPFAISLDYILRDLGANTPPRKDHDYYDISPFPNAFAYGHAACTTNLTVSDCSDCLGAAVGLMNSTCGMAIGARAVLFDCSTRYEQYPFVN